MENSINLYSIQRYFCKSFFTDVTVTSKKITQEKVGKKEEEKPAESHSLFTELLAKDDKTLTLKIQMEDISREESRLSKDQNVCRSDHQTICLIPTKPVNLKWSLISCPVRLLRVNTRTQTCWLRNILVSCFTESYTFEMPD